MRSKRGILLMLLCLIITSIAFGQDTVFVKRHLFDERVRNVFEVKNTIHLKTNTKLFRLEDGNWLELDHDFKERYVVYEKGKFLGKNHISQNQNLIGPGFYELLPTRNQLDVSAVVVDNTIYAVAEGSLFEYRIYNHYNHLLSSTSVRSIYPISGRPGQIYVGTYGGLYVMHLRFINNRREYTAERSKEPAYLNGRIVEHMNKILLCVDDIVEFQPDGSLIRDHSIYDFDQGNVRDLAVYKGDLYAQNTTSITRYDSLKKKMITVSSQHMYSTMEVVGDHLYFGTVSGELYRITGMQRQPSLVAKFESEITDLHLYENKLFIAEYSKGLHTADTAAVDKARLTHELPQTVSVITSQAGNLWIGTEDGLYLSSKDMKSVTHYLPGIEFNRYATARIRGLVFFGATTGLYEVSDSEVDDHLAYLKSNIVRVASNGVDLYSLLIGIIFLLLMVVLYLATRNRRKENDKASVVLNSLTIDEFSAAIAKNNIQSVEQLAEHYETNPVQLHRRLKVFNLTPGKLLRQVKLAIADEMKESGEIIDDISKATGYSTNYLQNHWKAKAR